MIRSPLAVSQCLPSRGERKISIYFRVQPNPGIHNTAAQVEDINFSSSFIFSDYCLVGLLVVALPLPSQILTSINVISNH